MEKTRSIALQRYQRSKCEMAKKEKETKVSKEVEEKDNYDRRMPALLPFAHPLAPKKMNKKVLKTVKRASKAKHVKRGVKEVVKALRKGEKGFGGDCRRYLSPRCHISHPRFV